MIPLRIQGNRFARRPVPRLTRPAGRMTGFRLLIDLTACSQDGLVEPVMSQHQTWPGAVATWVVGGRCLCGALARPR